MSSWKTSEKEKPSKKVIYFFLIFRIYSARAWYKENVFKLSLLITKRLTLTFSGALETMWSKVKVAGKYVLRLQLKCSSLCTLSLYKRWPYLFPNQTIILSDFTTMCASKRILFVYIDGTCIDCHNQLIRTLFEGQPLYKGMYI